MKVKFFSSRLGDGKHLNKCQRDTHTGVRFISFYKGRLYLHRRIMFDHPMSEFGDHQELRTSLSCGAMLQIHPVPERNPISQFRQRVERIQATVDSSLPAQSLPSFSFTFSNCLGEDIFFYKGNGQIYQPKRSRLIR